MIHDRCAQEIRSDHEDSILHMQICFFFFHWLIYNAHHSESKHVMQLEGGGGKTTLRMVMCERVSYVCGSCCVDSCQWQSDASQWAHVRDYVRNWTEHSIMNRFFYHETNGVNASSFYNILQQNQTQACKGSHACFSGQLNKKQSIYTASNLLHELPIWQWRSAVGW